MTLFACNLNKQFWVKGNSNTIALFSSVEGILLSQLSLCVEMNVNPRHHNQGFCWFSPIQSFPFQFASTLFRISGKQSAHLSAYI